MGREWKPGDVARMTTPSGNVVTYIKTRWRGDWWGVDQHGDTYTNRKVDDSVRPLVAIDPEDREAVERLWRHTYDGSADALQAALREFANPKPPRPEEPLAMAAVVEDKTGRHWVRVAPAMNGLNYPWHSGKDEYHYDDIDVVRVLAKGLPS